MVFVLPFQSNQRHPLQHDYCSEINMIMISLGSFLNCIALLKSEKLTLRVSLRDKAGEIRYTKQILAIETNWIKAEFRF